MTKTYCDRCKEEIKGHVFEQSFPMADLNTTYFKWFTAAGELCPSCFEFLCITIAKAFNTGCTVYTLPK